MPFVSTSIIVSQSVDEVYNLLKDMERFSEFMRDIKKSKVVKREGDKMITEWEAEVDGAPLRWVEEDIIDEKEKRISFRMLESDYESCTGEWKVEATSGGTKITLSANFNWGIPNLERFVGHILKRKAYKGLHGMLRCIKKELKRQERG